MSHKRIRELMEVKSKPVKLEAGRNTVTEVRDRATGVKN